MEDITVILTNFVNTFNEYISAYYQRCYSYIKDLFADKKIDIAFKIAYEPDDKREATVDKMIKTIKLALSTIGVSRKRLAQEEPFLRTIPEKKGEEYVDYNSYFEKHLRYYVDRILFEIIWEYLTQVDTQKIDNLDLFDLLPRNFLNQLETFRAQFLSSSGIKNKIANEIENLEDYLNPTHLTMKVTTEGIEQKTIEETEEFQTAEGGEESQEMILQQLDEIKKTNLDALKMSIKKSVVESVKGSIKPQAEPEVTEQPSEQIASREVSFEQISEKVPVAPQEVTTKAPEPKLPPIPEEPKSESIAPEIPEPPKEPPIEEKPDVTAPPEPVMPPSPSPPVVPLVKPAEISTPRSFLDYFANMPVAPTSEIANISINQMNLINSGITNLVLFDLESLFYYIKIFKMLNLDLPFENEKIFQILKKHIKDQLFTSSISDKPDPVSMFFGLSILSELSVLNSTDLVDLLDTEMFLESELNHFLVKKMHLNFYTLLCLRIMEKSGAIIADKSGLLSHVLSVNIKELENYNPTLDIFEHLSLIKLLDNTTNLGHFKALYKKEIKNLMTPNGSINNTITDSARTILILKLLKINDFPMTQPILKYIDSATEFFTNEHNYELLAWNKDNLGFKIELRMLFWALFVHLQNA